MADQNGKDTGARLGEWKALLRMTHYMSSQVSVLAPDPDRLSPLLEQVAAELAREIGALDRDANPSDRSRSERT